MITVSRGDGRSGTLFGVVVGIMIGVLIGVLVVPKRQDTTRVAGGARSSSGVTAGESTPANAGGVPTEALAPAGQTGVSAAPGAASGGVGAARSAVVGGSAGGGGGSGVGSIVSPGGASRGVTATSVKIGIGVPDLGAIAALGPGYDQGDLQAHAAAVLEGWKRDKLVPVAGRNVEFAYRKYNIIDQNAQRAACLGLTQDEKVFMVVAVHDFADATECVAREFKTPVITSDSPTHDPSDDVYARGAPLLYSLQMSGSRLSRNYITWAHQRGLLKGKRIGLYYPNYPAFQRIIDKDVKGVLSKLGYKPAAEVTTDRQGATTGGPNDTIAMQRFRAARVDLALLFVSPIAITNFMQQANVQAYRPMYLTDDLAYGTTDTGAGTYPPSQIDGTYGLTGMRFGEWKSGLGVPPPAQRCEANDARVTGRKVDPSQRDAEWIAMNQVCDELAIVLRVLQSVGRNLTQQTFVAALQSSVRNMQLGIHANVTFAPGKEDGVDQLRTLQFHADCKCWKVVDPFAPALVP